MANDSFMSNLIDQIGTRLGLPDDGSPEHYLAGNDYHAIFGSTPSAVSRSALQPMPEPISPPVPQPAPQPMPSPPQPQPMPMPQPQPMPPQPAPIPLNNPAMLMSDYRTKTMAQQNLQEIDDFLNKVYTNLISKGKK